MSEHHCCTEGCCQENQGLKQDIWAEKVRLETELASLHDHLQKMQVTNGSLTDQLEKEREELAILKSTTPRGLYESRDLWKERFHTADNLLTIEKSKTEKLVGALRAVKASTDWWTIKEVVNEALSDFEAKS